MKKLLKTLLPLGAITAAAIPAAVSASCGTKTNPLDNVIVLSASLTTHKEKNDDGTETTTYTHEKRDVWEKVIAKFKEKYPTISKKYSFKFNEKSETDVINDVTGSKGINDSESPDLLYFPGDKKSELTTAGAVMDIPTSFKKATTQDKLGTDANGTAINIFASATDSAFAIDHKSVKHIGKGLVFWSNRTQMAKIIFEGADSEAAKKTNINSLLISKHTTDDTNNIYNWLTAQTAETAETKYKVAMAETAAGKKDSALNKLSLEKIVAFMAANKGDNGNKLAAAAFGDYWGLLGLTGAVNHANPLSFSDPLSTKGSDGKYTIPALKSATQDSEWSDGLGTWYDWYKAFDPENRVEYNKYNEEFFKGNAGMFLSGTWDENNIITQFQNVTGGVNGNLYALPLFSYNDTKDLAHFQQGWEFAFNKRNAKNSTKQDALSKLLALYYTKDAYVDFMTNVEKGTNPTLNILPESLSSRASTAINSSHNFAPSTGSDYFNVLKLWDPTGNTMRALGNSKPADSGTGSMSKENLRTSMVSAIRQKIEGQNLQGTISNW